MTIRYFKVLFVLLIGLLCLFYAIQNVVNLGACYQAFAYVMGAVDHQVYTSHIIPPTDNSAVIWFAMTVVVGLEFIAGLCACKGAWDLWRARNASAEIFHEAKKFALIGCGLGILIWLGFFAAVGGALFFMWQTDVGRGSLENAFQFFGACAFIFLILLSVDD